ncbi:MAG: hypothetical protein QY312_01240 [Candidatus Dojkabacteria bacterium]|nr:MAG: hypothetical protein QY312_01240 [Candidatus Dojkabacteria bacterium]
MKQDGTKNKDAYIRIICGLDDMFHGKQAEQQVRHLLLAKWFSAVFPLGTVNTEAMNKERTNFFNKIAKDFDKPLLARSFTGLTVEGVQTLENITQIVSVSELFVSLLYFQNLQRNDEYAAILFDLGTLVEQLLVYGEAIAVAQSQKITDRLSKTKPNGMKLVLSLVESKAAISSLGKSRIRGGLEEKVRMFNVLLELQWEQKKRIAQLLETMVDLEEILLDYSASLTRINGFNTVRTEIFSLCGIVTE